MPTDRIPLAGTPSAPSPRGTPEVVAPPGHIGPLRLPGNGRLVWWTGRVAIGLRHEGPAARPCGA